MKSRRWAAISAGMLLAMVASPVAAKFPYFSVELDPEQPVAGEPVTVIVRLWADPAHTDPEHWYPPTYGVIEDILEFRSGDTRLPIRLARHDDGSYRATVQLAAGDWRLVAFPGSAEGLSVPGYPGIMAFDVEPRAAALPGAAVAAVAIVLGLIAAAIGGRYLASQRQGQSRTRRAAS